MTRDELLAAAVADAAHALPVTASSWRPLIPRQRHFRLPGAERDRLDLCLAAYWDAWREAVASHATDAGEAALRRLRAADLVLARAELEASFPVRLDHPRLVAELTRFGITRQAAVDHEWAWRLAETIRRGDQIRRQATVRRRGVQKRRRRRVTDDDAQARARTRLNADVRAEIERLT